MQFLIKIFLFFQKLEILAILDTGAYGFSMASNYNSMFRPAEVLLDLKGEAKLIRKRESFADLTNNQIF